MHFSETHNIFPRPGRTATVTCPQCGTSRSVAIDPLSARTGPLKVQCSCGPVFGIMQELRRTWRKTVCVDGRFSVCRQNEPEREMIIKNISTLGIGFVTLSGHDLLVGEKLRIAFTLDDHTRKEIKTEAIVRAVNGNTIGCEFTENKESLAILEQYLKSKK